MCMASASGSTLQFMPSPMVLLGSGHFPVLVTHFNREQLLFCIEVYCILSSSLVWCSV
jgi:hypothetical protein